MPENTNPNNDYTTLRAKKTRKSDPTIFEQELEKRPKVFGASTLCLYVGGAKGVWKRILKDSKYNEVFVLQPDFKNPRYTTDLSREELITLYEKDIEGHQNSISNE